MQPEIPSQQNLKFLIFFPATVIASHENNSVRSKENGASSWRIFIRVPSPIQTETIRRKPDTGSILQQPTIHPERG